MSGIVLPAPRSENRHSLEWTLQHRRSIRALTAAPISLGELGQLLWAAQGVTGNGGYRTAPSAGALYPLEVYAITGSVRDLDEGVYRYDPVGHQLSLVTHEAKRDALRHAAHEQHAISDNAVLFLVAAIEARTRQRYGKRATRYVHMEAGHAAQNLLLQAVALGLGAVVMGAFDDAAVHAVMNLSAGEDPLYLIPVGPVQS